MAFSGMNIEAMRDLSGVFHRSGRRMGDATQQITAQLAVSTWDGEDARRFQGSWAQIRAQLLRIDDELEHLAQVIKHQCDEQERTSRSRSGNTFGRRIYGFGGNAGPAAQGRMTVISAIMDLDNPNQVGHGQIVIRRLDNGRYVVILPGVEDLTDSLRQAGPGFAFGGPPGALGAVLGGFLAPSGSFRDMRYAMMAAFGGPNGYADAVKQAMQDAGVPAGSDVMIVGHSYGAYTAVDLASDTSFNSATGSGYHVNVTHAVAVGADTDWNVRDVPANTNVLIANNRADLVYQAETPAQMLNQPGSAGNVHNVHFNGGFDGFGHDPQNYSDWMTTTDDNPDLNSFWSSVGGDYATPGRQFTVGVLD